ncbi:acyl-CoA dehydrogenase family protein [Smaragdicoccus niigatensis]|uniref:acyl-CoA dehydrogenase family protein n=1 Tax=Smaragdicoccus niigatensis TaxID=359359 RepID=UPI00037E17B6|nr:acyl-CoA dehydrogenase family protein [Smaragdicoccus niigatensis]
MKRTLYTAEHEEFRASVREFVRRWIEPRAEKFIEDKFIDRDVWRAAGDLGYLGLGVPEQYGGGEAGDFRYSAVVTEELARVAVAYASSFSIHYDVVAPYLIELSTEEQKKRWLPKFCTGELVSAMAMSEPSAGSDLAALKTTAVRDGDDWILNGSKTFITNGISADLVIVAARTTPEKKAKGISLFVVEEGMQGFTRGRKLDKVGQPEADTGELSFEDVRVPGTNLLGEVDRGFIAMMERLPQERIGAAITNIAHAKAVLEETIQYAKDRKAFGQSIGSFQHNKFLLADLVTRLEAAQAYVDHHVLAHTNGELDAVDAAKAKWYSAQVQNEIIDHCVQIYGGYGYMNEYRVARAWKDARVTKIWAGSNEIMKEIIGRSLGF